MSSENHHDPVNALSEEDATGRTAEIFAKIREVMEIPMVTSTGVSSSKRGAA
jgi:hypothetical protein